MSTIRKEIERYMTGSTAAGSSLTACFTFPEQFAGFQGHFPTQKVLPGACQIQCAITAIEKKLGQRVALREIALAKFTAPIVPGDGVQCLVSRASEENGVLVYKARITKGADKVSELKLYVTAGAPL